MAELEGIQEIVNQAAIQAVIAVMMTLKEIHMWNPNQPLQQAKESHKGKDMVDWP